MQNTCNLANCTLHSAHVISHTAVEWRDFNVSRSAVTWIWQGKWTFAWNLQKVKKTSDHYCFWRGLIAACVTNYKADLHCEAKQILCVCDSVQTNLMTDINHCPYINTKCRGNLLRCICRSNTKTPDEARNIWALNPQLAQQLLL